MTPQELLKHRKDALSQIIQSSIAEAPVQSLGFALSILNTDPENKSLLSTPSPTPVTPERIQYAGYTGVAYLGFRLAAEKTVPDEEFLSFTTGLSRLRLRSGSSLNDFIFDDVAMLGIANGLVRLRELGRENVDAENWLLELIDKHPTSNMWSSRMRALAGDLLDGRGRLHVLPDFGDTDIGALEVVIRNVWPNLFRGGAGLDSSEQSLLLEKLLTEELPRQGELERASVWLNALDTLISYASQSLLPTVSDTARILESIQHSLKRWVWTEKPRRKEALPSRWLIDNEYDVQALLWAILYPIYGADLVDETYLPNWGVVQPRADLGIIRLKLIIEVKFAREARDFQKFEGEIGGDLGLYFKDTSQFDRMIAFIYDDCDKQHVEKYDSLKNALKKRERIEDVIIVRRPGMLPGRGQRNV